MIEHPHHFDSTLKTNGPEKTVYSKSALEAYRYLITTNCAEFFPPPENDDQGAWPSWVDGLRLDDLGWWQVRVTLDDSYFAQIYVQTLEQVLTVLAELGLLVTDRNPKNIFLLPISQEKDQAQMSFVDQQGRWQVTQIDLGNVIDFTGKEVYFGISPHRKYSGEIRDPEGAKKELAKFLESIAFELSKFVQEDEQKKLDEMTILLYSQLADIIRSFAHEIDSFFDKKRVLFWSYWVVNKDRISTLLTRLNSLLEKYYEQRAHKNNGWGITHSVLKDMQKLRTVVDDF